jgi:hypothetical protein
MAEKVTLAEAKALGFNSTKGITKEGGMYKFDTSLLQSEVDLVLLV